MLRVAHEFGWTLDQVLAQPPRVLDGILAWLQEQWNEPSRTDWYLMQVACEIVRGRVKKPRSIGLKDFKLPFKTLVKKLFSRHPDPDDDLPSAPPRMTETMAAKNKWLGALMGPQQAADILMKDKKQS